MFFLIIFIRFCSFKLFCVFYKTFETEWSPVYIRWICLSSSCATQGCGVRFEALLYAWLATAPLCLSSVQWRQRRGQTSLQERGGNAFLLPSQSAFSADRYFAEEFNEELPHNLQLPASLFSRTFLWTFIISSLYREIRCSKFEPITMPRAYLKSNNDSKKLRGLTMAVLFKRNSI